MQVQVQVQVQVEEMQEYFLGLAYNSIRSRNGMEWNGVQHSTAQHPHSTAQDSRLLSSAASIDCICLPLPGLEVV